MNNPRLLIVDDEAWKNWSNVWQPTVANQQLDAAQQAFLADQLAEDTALAIFAPRGQGPYPWTDDARKANQIRRRFYLLGQTRDGMRTWDIRQAIRHSNCPPPIPQRD